MKHIDIFIILLNLAIGIIAIVIAFQNHKKFKLLFLKSFRIYLIYFNLMVFVAFSYRYTFVNVFGENFDNFDLSLLGLLTLLIFLGQYGMTYYLVKTVLTLLGKGPNSIFQTTSLIIGGLFLVGLIACYNYFYFSNNLSPLYYLMEVWIFSWLSIILISLVSLKINIPSNLTSKIQKKSIGFFTLLLIISYSLYGFTELNFYFIQLDVDYFDSGFLMSVNIAHLVWLKYFFPEYTLGIEMKQFEGHVKKLVQNYNISRREEEVIKLLLIGKSNKEIEDALFISYNTVKNHVYNIYQKIGITNRGQLFALIRKYYSDNAF